MEVVIDPKVWYDLKRDLDKFEPGLSRALRRKLKTAGDIGAAAIKAKLSMSSPDGGPDKGKVRAGLAAATRTSVSFAAKTAGVKIVTSSARLPAENAAMVKAYNTAKFRHPVFGRGWVDQKGRPYFGAGILGKEDPIRREITQALDDAMKAIGART